MRIFTSFLIILLTIFLLVLPYTSAIYDFRTDIRTENHPFTTAVGITTGNLTLYKAIYDNDTTTLTITSDSGLDFPLFSSYNGTTHLVGFTGLSDNSTRTLSFEYDTASFDPAGAISNFMDQLPWIWMLCIVMLIPASLVYIFWGRRLGLR